MTITAPPQLGDSDQLELLRIAMVYAKEWLRSGRKPPGAPHRPCLLAPSAAWLRLRTDEMTRDAVQLASHRPLWETVAELAVTLVGAHPSPTLGQLGAARFEAIVLGRSTPLPLVADDAALGQPSWQHLAVSLATPAVVGEDLGGSTAPALPAAPTPVASTALIPAPDAMRAGWTVAEHLGACLRRVGLAEDAWRHERALVYAFDAPLFTS